MKTMKIAAIALLIAALPIAPAAFAHERDHDRYETSRPAHGWEHGDRDQNWGRGHRHDRYCHHTDRHYYQSNYRYDDDYARHSTDGYRTQVILPLPPLLRIPVPLVPKLHHGHIELRPAF